MSSRSRQSRNKSSNQPHLRHIPQNQSQQHNAQHHRQSNIKEEPPVQLHDEADLISFRSDGLSRFISNQEYFENIASKPIHNSKIIPPPSFPLEQPITVKKAREISGENSPTEEQSKLYLSKPEELFFGDPKLMQLKEKILKSEIEDEQHRAIKIFDENSEYTYQSKKLERLAELQSKINDEGSIEIMEKELNLIFTEYKEKFGKTYRSMPSSKTFSIPHEEISKSIEVTKAPDSYNPRLINSLINIGSNNNNNNGNSIPNTIANDFINNNGIPINYNKIQNVSPHLNGSHDQIHAGGLDMSHFVGGSGNTQRPTTVPTRNSGIDYSSHENSVSFLSHLDKQPSHHQSPIPNSASQQPSGLLNNSDNTSDKIHDSSNFNSNNMHIPNDDLGLSIIEAKANDPKAEANNINSSSNQHGSVDHHHSGMVDDDINQLLDGADGNDGIVNDDMGDLINFEDDGDDGMISSHAFDTDFLSQIDHSME